MYKLGLIGYPLSHSISGVIQKAGLQSLNLEGSYEILETNYKNQIGEIDIIAKDGERYVFVEVKARSTAMFGYPREAVTPKKQHTIKLVASCYLKSNKLYDVYTRFDVIEILAGKITHLINAF